MPLLYFIQSYGKEEDNKSPFSWIDGGEDNKMALVLSALMFGL